MDDCDKFGGLFRMVHQIKIVTAHSDLKKKVFYFAITSRLFVLLLSFVSNILLPDHDAGVFQLPQQTIKSNLADRVVKVLFGGLARWDAQYFLHITLYGYTYENTLAFFPLFPFLTRILAYVLEMILGNILNSLSVVLISAVVLNFLFFVNAATALFELSCDILKDEKLAYISALLFCANPASIFFSAAYSESCFSFFTFSGMLNNIKNNNEIVTSLACGLSACVRSNGLLNFGFIAHKTLKNIVQCLSFNKPFFSCVRFVIIKLIELSIYTVIFFVPFLLFQVYTYHRFCIDKAGNVSSFLKNFGEANGYILPGLNKSPWCNFSIPFSYSYVQHHYWGVGFLKYYELKQIPNFLLAFPIIYWVLRNSYGFIEQNKSSLKLLGLNNLKFVKFQNRVLRAEFFVFVVHAYCLTVFCMLFINIQVTTRMIASSCPVFYWFVTLRYWSEPEMKGNHIKIESRLDKTNPKFSLVETKDNIESFWKTCLLTQKSPNKWFYGLRFYFISYILLGTVLFSNFYPWT